MKTAMFGCVNFIITVMTIVCVLHVCNFHFRANNLQDNLQGAMEASLRMALYQDDAGYTIENSDELVADVVEGVALYLANESALTVVVNEVNIATGLLSMTITEHYVSPSGKTTDIVCTQTVLLEKYTAP